MRWAERRESLGLSGFEPKFSESTCFKTKNDRRLISILLCLPCAQITHAHTHACRGWGGREVISVTRTQTMTWDYVVLVTVLGYFTVCQTLHHHLTPQQPCRVKTDLAWPNSFNGATTTSKLHALASPLLCLMSMELTCLWDPS